MSTRAAPVPDADVARGIGGFVRAHGLRVANVAVLALLVAVLYHQVDAAELRAAVRDANLRFVAAAFALNLPVGALFAIRSHFVLLRLGHRVEPRVLVPAMVLGNVAGSLTPASAGELLRAAALRSHAKIPATDGIALVLFERGVSIYLLALGTGVAAAAVSLSLVQALAVAAAAVPLFAAPAFAPVLLRLLPAPGTGERTSLTARAFAHVHEAAGQLRWIFEDRRLLIGWSVVTAAIFAVFTVQFWLLARASPAS